MKKVVVEVFSIREGTPPIGEDVLVQLIDRNGEYGTPEVCAMFQYENTGLRVWRPRNLMVELPVKDDDYWCYNPFKIA